MRRRRGPGLVGTAVLVGGAAHAGRKSAERSQAEAEQDAQIQDLQAQQQAPPQQAAPPPPPPPPAPAAPAAPDPIAEIQKFAALKDQGILTEEEFAAKKAQILGI